MSAVDVATVFRVCMAVTVPGEPLEDLKTRTEQRNSSADLQRTGPWLGTPPRCGKVRGVQRVLLLGRRDGV
jgi:hypothetical protein